MPADDRDALEIQLQLDGVRVALTHEPDIHSDCLLVEMGLGDIGVQPDAACRLLRRNAALLEFGTLTLGSPPGTDQLSYFVLLKIAGARPDGVADWLLGQAQECRLRQNSGINEVTLLMPPQQAIAPRDHDPCTAFDENVLRLSEYARSQPKVGHERVGDRCSVSLDAEGLPFTLAHRSRHDLFCTAGGVGLPLSEDVAESVARRLLHGNAEFAHEAAMAFGLSEDEPRVVWRVTSWLPCADPGDWLDYLWWAHELASPADADRQAAPAVVHLLA